MIKKHGFEIAALAFSAALAAPIVHAQLMPPVETEEVNLIGIAGGVAPDFMGSGHEKGAGAPLFRYQFEGTQRYVAWVGPTGYFNILNDENWRFGPMANFRPGRGSSVNDLVVSQMQGINNAWEGGVFLQYRYKLSEQKMHQLVFTVDVAGGSNGTVGNPRVLWWQPLSQNILLNLGFGATVASSKWMNTYFGITNPHDIALFPTQNGLPYNAGSGVKGVNVPFGLTFALSKEWLLSAGGRYEKLLSDAKDSPIVQQHGKDNQWIGGIGLTYLF